MLDVESRIQLLRKRVESLNFPPEIMIDAERIVVAAGMKLPDAVKMLWKEWLNDMVATSDAAEFRLAASNPGQHFLSWARERAKERFHVTSRAVDAVVRRMGTEFTSRIIYVVWPQEIAWAQRLRLSENPNTATKAAMFLREAEGNPSKVFNKIADIYSEAFTKVGYSDNAAQDISAQDIRFADIVPDFSPLFIKYAARHYADVLNSMTRETIEALAARASRDERQERHKLSAQSSVEAARKFPMRRIVTIISACSALSISPNQLFLMENAFLAKLENGEFDIELGTRIPHVQFAMAISSEISRKALLETAVLSDFDQGSTIWEIAKFNRKWLDRLPESYKKWSQKWQVLMERWQFEIVEEKRETPYDPVSDFGFYLIENYEA